VLLALLVIDLRSNQQAFAFGASLVIASAFALVEVATAASTQAYHSVTEDLSYLPVLVLTLNHVGQQLAASLVADKLLAENSAVVLATP